MSKFLFVFEDARTLTRVRNAALSVPGGTEQVLAAKKPKVIGGAACEIDLLEEPILFSRILLTAQGEWPEAFLPQERRAPIQYRIFNQSPPDSSSCYLAVVDRWATPEEVSVARHNLLNGAQAVSKLPEGAEEIFAGAWKVDIAKAVLFLARLISTASVMRLPCDLVRLTAPNVPPLPVF